MGKSTGNITIEVEDHIQRLCCVCGIHFVNGEAVFEAQYDDNTVCNRVCTNCAKKISEKYVALMKSTSNE